MSAAPQRRYSAALIAAAAHQLGSGEVELTQWRELHALLLLADNQAAAVRLEQLFNTPPAESALLAAQRAELLAALAVQPLGGQHQQSRSALAQPLRASLVAFLRSPERGWQPPAELNQLALPAHWPRRWLEKIIALQPFSGQLFNAGADSRQALLAVLAGLDLYCHGDDQPPSADQQAWLERQQQDAAAVAGDHCATSPSAGAEALLAGECLAELATVVQQLERTRCIDGAGGTLAAVLALLPEQLAALSFAPAAMLNYLKQSEPLTAWQQQQLCEQLAELACLLRAASVGAPSPLTTDAAQLHSARVALAEQLAVTIVGIERLLDHHQLQAIDGDLCRQLQQQFEQLAAALALLGEPLFSSACNRLAAQLEERRRAVDHRLKTAELATIAQLLTLLEVMLERRRPPAQWGPAALFAVTAAEIAAQVGSIAAAGWHRGAVSNG